MAPSLLSRYRVQHNGRADSEHRRTSTFGVPAGLGPDNLNGNDSAEVGENQDRSRSTSPSALGQRRVRSESQDMDEQRAQKRRKQFASALCISKGLSEDLLDDFIKLDQSQMLITIRVGMLESQAREQKSEAEKYILSDEFKDITRDRLRACLLSPNLPAYVLGLGDQIFAFAKQHSHVFKIPQLALEDPEMSGKIIILIKDLLTNQRSNMKQKISNHIASRSHVSALAKSLALSGGYEITAAHWARIAFLRDSLAGFPNVVKESLACSQARAEGEGSDEDDSDGESSDSEHDTSLKNKVWSSTEFWEYIDHVLRELRAEARKAEVTPAARAKYLQMFFTNCLQNDFTSYPGTIGCPAMPAYDKVTVPWQVLIHTELIW